LPLFIQKMKMTLLQDLHLVNGFGWVAKGLREDGSGLMDPPSPSQVGALDDLEQRQHIV